MMRTTKNKKSKVDAFFFVPSQAVLCLLTISACVYDRAVVYNVAYAAPVDESLHSVLALSLLGVGAVFLAWFFVYEITTTDSATVRRSKSLLKEILLAAVASAFLAFGTLFLLLWVGLYV
jgi:hypothetical protein